MRMLKPTFLAHRRGHFRIRPFLLLLFVILTVATLGNNLSTTAPLVAVPILSTLPKPIRLEQRFL